MRSYFQLFESGSEEVKFHSSQLGLAAQLMFQSSRHQKYPLSYLNHVVEPALRHDQLKFYYDFRGEPVAYVIWAYLTADVENRFLSDGFWKLHISEWNEGSHLWVIDLVAKPGLARRVLRRFSTDVLTNEKAVRYFRYRGDSVICKEHIFPAPIQSALNSQEDD